MTGFAIDKEEGIMNATNGTAVTVADIVVNNIAETARTRDQHLVSILFDTSLW